MEGNRSHNGATDMGGFGRGGLLKRCQTHDDAEGIWAAATEGRNQMCLFFWIMWGRRRTADRYA